MHRGTSIGILAFATWLLALVSACSEELAEGACETPAASQRCDCPDGRTSVQTCSAQGLWGACYCYRPGCGNGEVDDAEDCDDGNVVDGDGCSAMCVIEPGGPGGGGPGGGGSTTITTSTTTTTSTAGGMGGMGGLGGIGGVGGIGGAGGTAGAGGV